MKIDACDWLRSYLRDGPVEVNEIRRAAKAAGYSRLELREAKWACCIVVTNNWSQEHPFTDRWFWSLSEDGV